MVQVRGVRGGVAVYAEIPRAQVVGKQDEHCRGHAGDRQQQRERVFTPKTCAPIIVSTGASAPLGLVPAYWPAARAEAKPTAVQVSCKAARIVELRLCNRAGVLIDHVI